MVNVCASGHEGRMLSVQGSRGCGETVQGKEARVESPVNFSVSSAVSVPEAWLEKYYPGEDPALAVEKVCPNGYSVRENFVAGLDPTDADARLTASISITNDSVYITWEPYLNGSASLRLYKVNAKRALTDADWHWPAKKGDCFFRVTVEMPNGEDPSDVPGMIPPPAPFAPLGVQLWENGPYFSRTNIGAENPWDAGFYFWWGDTVGYKRENDQWVASDGSAVNFSFDASHALTSGKDSKSLRQEGWTVSSGSLAPGHDAAQVHWGRNWRIATSEEVEDMIRNTTSEWITTNGVTGRLVKGKGAYSSSSIFLPAAGGANGDRLDNFGSWGYVWASKPHENDSSRACRLNFTAAKFVGGTNYRYIGQPIRPIYVPGE